MREKELDTAIKTGLDALKTAFRKVVQKADKATRELKKQNRWCNCETITCAWWVFLFSIYATKIHCPHKHWQNNENKIIKNFQTSTNTWQQKLLSSLILLIMSIQEILKK